MKILAFSDLHRDVVNAQTLVDASVNADVLVVAGDFATRNVGEAAVIDILKLTTCPVILVSGNHDRLEELRALCAGWDNGHLLHGDGMSYGGVDFFGLGCEVPLINQEPWNEGLCEDEATALLALCPPGAVLVTHSPPLGHADLQNDGTRAGSQAILDCIVMTKPVLNLCGHIHQAWGQEATIGKTHVRNLGPTLNWFTV